MSDIFINYETITMTICSDEYDSLDDSLSTVSEEKFIVTAVNEQNSDSEILSLSSNSSSTVDSIIETEIDDDISDDELMDDTMFSDISDDDIST